MKLNKKTALLMGTIPGAVIVHIVGAILGWDGELIFSIQIPFLIIQLFGLGLLIYGIIKN
jgi:hypothetical protein